MRTCTIEGCDAGATRRGWCPKHYTRWWRHGDPLLTQRATRDETLLERIMERLDVGDCWEWTRAVTSAGYGVIGFNDHLHLVHRAVWEVLVGPIPDDLGIDHLCRNRLCVNPDHLEPVPQVINFLRGAHPSARKARLRGVIA